MQKRKLLLSLGSLAAIATPVVAVVSCSNNTNLEFTIDKLKSLNYFLTQQKGTVDQEMTKIDDKVTFSSEAGDAYNLMAARKSNAPSLLGELTKSNEIPFKVNPTFVIKNSYAFFVTDALKAMFDIHKNNGNDITIVFSENKFIIKDMKNNKIAKDLYTKLNKKDGTATTKEINSFVSEFVLVDQESSEDKNLLDSFSKKVHAFDQLKNEADDNAWLGVLHA